MSALKHKTVSGFIWSFIDQLFNSGITFIAGVILARLLSPTEFGLVGMTTAFIAISNTFINGGFSNALIRKKNCTDVDYSTVFYFNLAVGLLFFLILQISAPAIASFFEQTSLTNIIRVISLVLVIDSFSIIQRTILTKRVDFKLQSRISIVSSLLSGTVAISMALLGFGYWSLVAQRLVNQACYMLLLWTLNSWRPLLVFSSASFKEHFGFGSKLLASGLIDSLYRIVYYIVIGKFFSAKELGYYMKSDGFKSIPSLYLNSIIGRVSYPILASMQDDKQRLKASYQKLIRSTMFITFVLMVGMAAVSEPMIITLIGEKWRPSIIYLQLLCFTGMLYPLHALNLNMLQLSGRSDLFLKLEIIKKTLAVPTIFIGIFWGIKMMIVGMIINGWLAYYINSYWSGRFIGYSFLHQLSDILPSLGLSLLMGISIYLLGLLLPLSYLWLLLIQVLFGATFIFLFCELTKFRDYLFLKNIVLEKLSLRNKK